MSDFALTKPRRQLIENPSNGPSHDAKHHSKCELCSLKKEKISNTNKRNIWYINGIRANNMALTDRFLGRCILVLVGGLVLLTLFYKIILIPLLPPADDADFDFLYPETALMVCEAFGFVLVGGLSGYTYYMFVHKDSSWIIFCGLNLCGTIFVMLLFIMLYSLNKL